MANQKTYDSFRTLQSDLGSMRACRRRLTELRNALYNAVGSNEVTDLLHEIASVGEELDARRRYLAGDQQLRVAA